MLTVVLTLPDELLVLVVVILPLVFLTVKLNVPFLFWRVVNFVLISSLHELIDSEA